MQLHRRKEATAIQSGYRKSETHVRVFFETLVHGNSKNEIDKETEEECKKGWVSKEEEKRAEIKSPMALTI